MKNPIILLWLLPLFVAVAGCRGTDSARNEVDVRVVQPAPADSPAQEAAPQQGPQAPPRDLDLFLPAWNNTLASRNFQMLAQYYGEDVDHYGRVLGREQLMERKRKYLERHPSFSQQVSDVRLKLYNETEARADFAKTYSIDGRVRKLRSYLVLERKNANQPWHIVAERDVLTNVEQEVGKPIPRVFDDDSPPCDRVVERVALELPRVQSMIKQQHTRHRIVRDPANAEQYLLEVYASGPNTETSENLGHFRIRPTAALVEEYSVLDGEYSVVGISEEQASSLVASCSTRP